MNLNIKNYLLIIVMSFITAGCTSNVIKTLEERKMQKISAGHTGCMPEDNKISNLTNKADSVLWTVVCKEKRYLCSGVHIGMDESVISCAIAVE